MVHYDNGVKRQSGMGGPFLTYTFYDQESGRVYMIDGMVFAPGYEKREFLRQVEVIAHTFKSGEEVNHVVDAGVSESATTFSLVQ